MANINQGVAPQPQNASAVAPAPAVSTFQAYMKYQGQYHAVQVPTRFNGVDLTPEQIAVLSKVPQKTGVDANGRNTYTNEPGVIVAPNKQGLAAAVGIKANKQGKGARLNYLSQRDLHMRGYSNDEILQNFPGTHMYDRQGNMWHDGRTGVTTPRQQAPQVAAPTVPNVDAQFGVAAQNLAAQTAAPQMTGPSVI